MRWWPLPASAAPSRARRFGPPDGRRILRLVLWLPLAFILVSGGILALLLSTLRLEAIKSGEHLNQSFARLTEEQTTRTIQAVDQTLQLARAKLSGSSAASPAGDRSIHEAFRELLASRPFIRSISALNAEGREIHTSDERVAGVDASDRAYFKLYAERPDVECETGAPVRGRAAAARPFIPATIPWSRVNGEFAGVIVASIEPRYFGRVWAMDDTGEDSSVALLRRDGVLLMRSPYIETMLGTSFAGGTIFRDLLPASPSGALQNASPVDGRLRLLSYRALSAYPNLVIVTGLGLDHVLAAWHRYVVIAVSGWVAASAALGGLAAWLAREWKWRHEGERKLAEAQLVNQRIFETSLDLILILDRTGTFTQVSPSSAQVLGYGPEEMIGRTGAELVHPDDLEATRNEMRAARRGRLVRDFNCRYRHKDGGVVTLSWTGLWSDAEQRYFFIGRDMTEREKAQSELRVTAESLHETKEMFAAIIDASPAAILALDPRRNVLVWNSAAEEIFGYGAAEVLNQAYKLVPPEGVAEYHDLVDRAMRGERLRDIEVVRLRKDGEKRQISFSCAPLFDPNGNVRAVIYQLQDITNRNALESQLRQAQKMEAVGQLTGGVAHDFNNLLGVVVGNLDILAERLEGDPAARELVDAALSGAWRGADLVRQMLAFSRQQPLEQRLVDLNEQLPRVVTLLKRTLGESITIKSLLAPGLWPVLADPVQLESVVLNLAINARDAMPKGGNLTIETANAHLDADYVALNPSIAAGDYVMTAVGDDGSGMPPEVIERAFDPFFTTKPLGKGTGLGLSMVYGFIRQSGGHIKIYSEVGHGTVIKIYLPRAEAPAIDGAATADAIEALPGGSESILLVEDNEDVRKMVERQMSALGYRVQVAENGPAALKLLDGGAAIDLLFTDVVMPGGMNGYELAAELRKSRPDLKVLLTSGYFDVSVRDVARATQGEPVLAKPYRRRDMAEMVRRVLDAKTSDGA